MTRARDDSLMYPTIRFAVVTLRKVPSRPLIMTAACSGSWQRTVDQPSGFSYSGIEEGISGLGALGFGAGAGVGRFGSGAAAASRPAFAPSSAAARSSDSSIPGDILINKRTRSEIGG